MNDEELDEILARDEQDRIDYETEYRWDRYIELRRTLESLSRHEIAEFKVLSAEFELRISRVFSAT